LKLLRQKNLTSVFDNRDLDQLKSGVEKSKNWNKIEDIVKDEENKKSECILHQNNLDEAKVRKQQQLRSSLDNSETLEHHLNCKNTDKKVLEMELNFGDNTSVDEVKNLFKGVHLISCDIDQNNLTGKHFGKGKIKVRVDDHQENLIQKRISETPNLSCKKVEQGNYNKKSDYMLVSGSKWYNNSVSQESKHYKEKDYDAKHRCQQEFGDSQIFNDKKYEYKSRDYEQEKLNDKMNTWNQVKQQNLDKPRGWKPMNPVKENANFLKSTLAHNSRSVNK